MTITNTEFLRNEILKLFLSGYTQQEISSQLNLSEGTVSQFIGDLANSDDSYRLQRQIAIALKKSGIELIQVAANLRWVNRIKLMALDDAKLEKFLVALQFYFKNNEIDPQMAAECLSSLLHTIFQSQIEPDRVKDEIESRYLELSTIKEKIRENKKTLYDSNSRLEMILRKNKVKKENIELFMKFRTIFALYDLDIQKIFDLARIAKNFEDLKWDLKSILSVFGEFNAVTDEISKLKKKCEEIQIILQKYRSKAKAEEIEWGKRYESLKIFENLIQTGLKPEDILAVSHILKNDFPQNLIPQLIEEISTYGTILTAKFKLEAELDKMEMNSQIKNLT